MLYSEQSFPVVSDQVGIAGRTFEFNANQDLQWSLAGTAWANGQVSLLRTLDWEFDSPLASQVPRQRKLCRG